MMRRCMMERQPAGCLVSENRKMFARVNFMKISVEILAWMHDLQTLNDQCSDNFCSNNPVLVIHPYHYKASDNAYAYHSKISLITIRYYCQRLLTF